MKLNLLPHPHFQLSGEPTGGNNQFNKIAGAMLLAAGLTFGGPVQAGEVTKETRAAVAAFLAANPDMEFMPQEQDCLDRKIKLDSCDKDVRDQLDMFKKELAIQTKQAQVDAKKTRVNEEGVVIDHASIVAAILQIESATRGNPDRSVLGSLKKIDNPSLQADITFLKRMYEKLERKEVISKDDTNKLTAMKIDHAGMTSTLYAKLSPEQQMKLVKVLQIVGDKPGPGSTVGYTKTTSEKFAMVD